MLSWTPGMTLWDLKKEAIRQALRFHKGNRQQTAAALGISIRNLSDWIRDYGLNMPRENIPTGFKPGIQ